MKILLKYGSGPDTALANYPCLAALLKAHGDPFRVTRLGSGRFLLEWSPIYPGADPAPEYLLLDPWRRADGRRLVRVTLAEPQGVKP